MIQNIETHTLQINGQDGTFSGYLALPASAPSAPPAEAKPGIVVLQEIFGVNAPMRAICDWLAHQGFCALCPDLFWRIEPHIELTDKTEDGLKRAFELFGLFDVNTGMTDIKTSLTALRNHGACNGKVGTLGFCLGGKLAFLSATRTDTDVSVSYYGVGLDALLDEAKNIKNPLLLHIAGKDEFVPPSAQNQIIKALENNPLVTINTYSQNDHAFARPDGMHYDAAAAEQANARTLCLFNEALKT